MAPAVLERTVPTQTGAVSSALFAVSSSVWLPDKESCYIRGTVTALLGDGASLRIETERGATCDVSASQCHLQNHDDVEVSWHETLGKYQRGIYVCCLMIMRSHIESVKVNIVHHSM